jgi:octaprenyl-diphosphate synthase
MSIVIHKELNLVKKLIKNEIIEEKAISDLYEYIFSSDGKKLRAKLSLISSSLNKRKNHKRLKLAAVIELLHTATLIHDDVVDDSQTRRGVKSVNNIWSNAHGVLIGDYIYSKAFILMVEIGEPKILQELANATNDISKGELIQLDALQNTKIGLEELKAISYFKTGRLFEASAKTGAALAGGDKSFVNSISRCAKYLGILFQIKDDLLDYSNNLNTGKPPFQDLKEGKVTYPFFFAYKNASKKEKKRLEDLLGNKKLNSTMANSLIQRLNGLKKTNELANKYHKNTIDYAKKINELTISKEMIKLADFAYDREK